MTKSIFWPIFKEAAGTDFFIADFFVALFNPIFHLGEGGGHISPPTCANAYTRKKSKGVNF